LEALKQPGLGGKEPSDDDYRLRFAHALTVDSDGRYGDGRVRAAPFGTRKRRGASVPPGLKGAVRVGIEATGHTHWFEAMLSELGHELWMGDAAKIRAAVVRKQKTDARDAAHLLDMLCTERFPKIWRWALAERDLRQLPFFTKG
jgi:transposase